MALTMAPFLSHSVTSVHLSVLSRRRVAFYLLILPSIIQMMSLVSVTLRLS